MAASDTERVGGATLASILPLHAFHNQRTMYDLWPFALDVGEGYNHSADQKDAWLTGFGKRYIAHGANPGTHR